MLMPACVRKLKDEYCISVQGKQFLIHSQTYFTQCDSTQQLHFQN